MNLYSKDLGLARPSKGSFPSLAASRTGIPRSGRRRRGSSCRRRTARPPAPVRCLIEIAQAQMQFAKGRQMSTCASQNHALFSSNECFYVHSNFILEALVSIFSNQIFKQKYHDFDAEIKIFQIVRSRKITIARSKSCKR